jgi:hypothetical protein
VFCSFVQYLLNEKIHKYKLRKCEKYDFQRLIGLCIVVATQQICLRRLDKKREYQSTNWLSVRVLGKSLSLLIPLFTYINRLFTNVKRKQSKFNLYELSFISFSRTMLKDLIFRKKLYNGYSGQNQERTYK